MVIFQFPMFRLRGETSNATFDDRDRPTKRSWFWWNTIEFWRSVPLFNNIWDISRASGTVRRFPPDQITIWCHRRNGAFRINAADGSKTHRKLRIRIAELELERGSCSKDIFNQHIIINVVWYSLCTLDNNIMYWKNSACEYGVENMMEEWQATKMKELSVAVWEAGWRNGRQSKRERIQRSSVAA
jgi:hypothetical protein